MQRLSIQPQDLAIVREILKAHVPGLEVWAFGSRVHGENLKPFSDLDLVVITEAPLGSLQLAELKDAFTDSALPFKVDVLDWSTTNERFQQLIRKHYLVVTEGGLLAARGRGA